MSKDRLKAVKKASKNLSVGGKVKEFTSDVNIRKEKYEKAKDLINFDFDRKIQLSETDLNPDSFCCNPLALQICQDATNYGCSVASIKQQLRDDILSACKLFVNPDLNVPIVSKVEYEQWAHCFNVVYTSILFQKLNSSVYRRNGVVVQFRLEDVCNLSVPDRYVFDQFKNGLKDDTERDVSEIRKIMHIAVGEFLGREEECGGLSCTESFSKECLSDFHSYAAKSVDLSSGDLVNISNLFEASKDVVPLLNIRNSRYNLNYVRKKKKMVSAKEDLAKANNIRKKLESAITIERRICVEASKKSTVRDNTTSRDRTSKISSLANMTSPTAAAQIPKRKFPQQQPAEPLRNEESVNLEIDKYFERKEFFHEVLNTKKPPGDLKAHCMLLSKKVMYDFRYCVAGYGTISEEMVLVYLYYVFNDAANDIFGAFYEESLANPFANFTPLHNNSENPSQNDYLRRSANASYHANARLRNVIECIRYMLLKDKIINAQTFFTSGTGEAFSITLLLALVKCKRQQDHFDFDPALYAPNEIHEDVGEEYIGTYLNFNGASLFINFDWFDWQTLDLDEGDLDPKAGKGEYKKLSMRPMSILVINGNLKHAGSANTSGKIIKKFFIYLDPCSGCRLKAVTASKDTSLVATGNYIYFDQYYKMIE